MNAIIKSTAKLILVLGVIAMTSSLSLSNDRRKSHERSPNRAEAKEAEQRLSDMGYWTGRIDGQVDPTTRVALVAFQKMEERKTTGRLTLDELEAIRNAAAPRPREFGYKHVEVDVDRQVLLLVDEEGTVFRILPVSTGSGKRYIDKGMKTTAYTPRGRFRVYDKVAGWKRSPLGLLYYPNYISGGVAIHGNPAVPTEPASHGCVRIPMFASREVSQLLPVGTIVLIYDRQSFVSAKDWAEEDKVKRVANVR